jgi:2-methylcitrate dehydratase PrpD
MRIAFIHELGLDDMPAAVVACARRLLLDLAGVAAAGSRTRLS